MGIASLHAANGSTSRVHAISARVIRLNDAYKDMTRARSALVRAYSTAREQASVDTGAIGSAQGSLDKSAAELQAFADAPAIEGQDEALRQDIVRLARTHAEVVQRGLDALRTTTRSLRGINTTDITASGAAYSAALERFQQQAGQLAQAEADRGAARYAMVVRLVGFGVVAALGLVVHALCAARLWCGR
ncbi:Tar ligand binding domain-containing protein [Burkholderia plantarii]|uniref:Tar ligand binding domain-containing protein n=1 Tax=Burkholderia plantarii TaxID=41899 RepID=UPI0018DE4E51|nr:Tar ligand binding domain-containing protein [Burkholderia plantarii]MBI0331817.1 Tar ligand binding domain-containing protein [Burkholderia plantarii]